MAFHNLRNQGHFAAEIFKNIARFRAQLDFHENQQALPQCMRVEAGVVAADDAFALEPAHALGNGGGGQAHFFGQFGHGDAGVLLQKLENFAIGFVEFFHFAFSL